MTKQDSTPPRQRRWLAVALFGLNLPVLMGLLQLSGLECPSDVAPTDPAVQASVH